MAVLPVPNSEFLAVLHRRDLLRVPGPEAFTYDLQKIHRPWANIWNNDIVHIVRLTEYTRLRGLPLLRITGFSIWPEVL